MAPLLPSARRLHDALAGSLRPNPPQEGRPFSLWTQRPEPEQPWVLRGEYAELEWALDDADLEAREPGTVVRVDAEGAVVWLGVIGPEGRRLPAPAVPDGLSRYRPKDWVDAWEGPRADASEMLTWGAGVDRPLLALAAAACAREALPLVRGGPSEGAAREAIEETERWARGEAPASAVRRAYEAAAEAVEEMPFQTLPSGVSYSIAYSAARAAANVAEAPTSPEAGYYAAAAAANALGQADLSLGYEGALRRMAPLVRRFLSLGSVLRARLAAPEPAPEAATARPPASRRRRRRR